MDASQFELLLHEDESAALDFKRDQYPFAKASDEDRSELLKDILGFANAFRRSDACILVGVDDVRGGPSTVVGVTQHLDDHSLQQFVAGLTNQPIQFSYEAFTFQGKKVGIITIGRQTAKPFYLKKDFGKLRKNVVYIRRGSGTDIQRPATPEEIASMRLPMDWAPDIPELTVEFAELARNRALGTAIEITTERRAVSLDDLPDFEAPRSRGPYGLDLGPSSLLGAEANWNFYREFANYHVAQGFFRPARLVVTNVGRADARDVRVVLQAQRAAGVVIVDSSEIPEAPERYRSQLDRADWRHLHAQRRREVGEVEVTQDDEESRSEADCGSLQPGRRIWCDALYIGMGQTSTAELSGTIYAANLPAPQRFTLTVTATVTPRTLTGDQVVALADRHSNTEDPDTAGDDPESSS